MFLQLIEITHFQKYIDGLLTDMQIPRQNMLSCKKYLRTHSFNIPFRYIFKKEFLEIYRLFEKNGITKTFYSCQMSMLKIDTTNEKSFQPVKKPKSFLSRLNEIARHAT